MAQVKLEFAGKSIPEKVSISETIITKMTGNTHFKTPAPPLELVTTTVKNLRDAYTDSRDGGKSKNLIKNQREKELDLIIRKLVDYVQFASGGDEQIILSSGMGVRSTPTPTTSVDMPTGLEAYIGSPNMIDLSWKPVNKAVNYEIQMSTDPGKADLWKYINVSSEAKYSVTGLESGKRYWFRVAAIGTRSLKSDYSDPATGMAG